MAHQGQHAHFTHLVVKGVIVVRKYPPLQIKKEFHILISQSLLIDRIFGYQDQCITHLCIATKLGNLNI